MPLPDDDAHAIALQLVRECRSEVDGELRAIHDRITENAWTPERAERLAEDVLVRAIPRIEDRMMTKLKIGVGEATLTVGKRAAQVIGIFVLAAAFYISSHEWPWNR